MTHTTICLTTLAAAMSLALATDALAAHPAAGRSLRDLPTRLALHGAHPTSEHALPDGYDMGFPAPYCVPSYVNAVHPISRVRGMGIDHGSDPTPDASPSLEDFTAIAGQVETGELVAISVGGYTGGAAAQGVKAYIDWNQDGLFDEAGESYLIGYLRYSNGADGKQAEALIRVPHSARAGATRMRVIKALDELANPWSCNEDGAGYGQAEDYTLLVGGVEREAIFCSTFEAGDPGSCDTPPAADIVHSGPLNAAIPPNASGLTVNFVTGELSTTALPVSHFSANQGDPFLLGPGLFFSWGSDLDNAGVALGSDAPYQVLAPGDSIGPSSTFTRHGDGTPSVMFGYWAGINGFLGVRFINEETGGINYGYVHLLTTSGSGFPAMILDYAYDRSGAAITIP